MLYFKYVIYCKSMSYTRFTPSLKFYTFSLSQSVKLFSLVWAEGDRCKVLYFCVIFSKWNDYTKICVCKWLSGLTLGIYDKKCGR